MWIKLREQMNEDLKLKNGKEKIKKKRNKKDEKGKKEEQNVRKG